MIMQIVCEVLDKCDMVFIFVLAIFEFYMMIKVIIIFAGFKRKINKLNGKGEKNFHTSSKEKNRKKISKTIIVESERDWDEFDQFLQDYQEKDSCYSVFSQSIQLFTLLGILGTVAGLYLAVSNGQDMTEGVELALSTTVGGIIWAVIYKIADVFIVSKFVNYIEDGIDRYEKIYQIDSEEAKLIAKENMNI